VWCRYTGYPSRSYRQRPEEVPFIRRGHCPASAQSMDVLKPRVWLFKEHLATRGPVDPDRRVKRLEEPAADPTRNKHKTRYKVRMIVYRCFKDCAK